jgi:hypothetical protein
MPSLSSPAFADRGSDAPRRLPPFSAKGGKALDPDVWPGALEGIRSFVRGCATNFYWQEVSKENAGVFHCVGIEPART